MRNIILLVAFAIATVSCTKDEIKDQICEAGKVGTAVVAVKLSEELACTNLEAIKVDLEAKLVDLKLCPKVEGLAKSAIGDAICGPMVEGLVGGSLTQLPAAWGCTGGPLADEVKAKLIAACKKAL